MGQLGSGIPVYYDMHAEQEGDEPRTPSQPFRRNDPTLGIAIGVLLSVACIIACLWLIVWHRRYLKRHPRQPNAARSAATSPNVSCSPVVAKLGDNFDQHEMETLIRNPMNITNLHVLDQMSIAAVEDGVTTLGPQNNGRNLGLNLKSLVPSEATLMPNDINKGSGERGEGSSDGKYGFIFSSTPHREHSDEKAPPAADDTSKEDIVADFSVTNEEEISNESPRTKRNNNVTTSTPRKPFRNGLANNAQVIVAAQITNYHLNTDNHYTLQLSPKTMYDPLDHSRSRLLADSSTLDSSKEDDELSTDSVNRTRFGRKPISSWNFRQPLVGPNG